MKIYNGLDEFKKLDFAIVTSGTFDGVHFGHQKILERLHEITKKNGGESVLLTYWPHPRLVLFPDQELYLLSSIEEKSELLSQKHVDHLVIIPFTKEFSSLSSEEFIKDILVNKLGTKKLVIGYDHKFGKNRSGSFEELKKDGPIYGFEVEEIPKQMVDNKAVSSTKIRKALFEGRVEIANEYLGRPFCVHGKVIEGDKIGRTLDFPTANIEVGFNYKLIPAEGIYAVKIKINHTYFKGMLNIGFRPTFGGIQKRIEVNIFNFDQNIYGEEIVVEFYRKIRSEIKFENLGALKSQLQSDKTNAQQILKNH
ncbi:MAG: bifunctional riboflavin kinase/FAD synthetase [Cyclobacteriaceae bacterium]|nr:bifunctional riboflavin kinase/FAD synthetase [Cyclobacteriaceae bacterium]